jgi:hypothetical protein
MTDLISTDDVLSAVNLLDLFSAGDGESIDLNQCDGVVQVCDGVWKLEPDGEMWRFWKFDEEK